MRHDVEDAIMKTRALAILMLFVLFHEGLAQSDIPIGTWRTHFSYMNVLRVANTDTRVYAATANGLFYVDNKDNSINKITKIDGLSDAGISTLKSSSDADVLAIGYTSGTIDFLEQNELVEFSDLAIAPQLEDRTIFDIEFNTSRIYIATSVGVVVLDRSTKSIIESYVEIGPNASSQPISDITLTTDSVYLATPIGMLIASLDPTLNLQDFNNWFLKNPEGAFSALRQVRHTGAEVLVSTGRRLFSYRNGVWTGLTDQLGVDQLERVRLANNAPFVITQNSGGASALFTDDLIAVDSFDQTITDAISSASGFYLGSIGAQLVHSVQGSQAGIAPSGPHTDRLSQLVFNSSHVIGIAEFSDFLERPIGADAVYSTFENGDWAIGNLSGLSDLSSVAGDYWGAYGIGVFNEATDVLIDEQTPGSPLLPPPREDYGPLITSIHQGTNGDLWIANYDANPSVHILSPEGEWNSLSLGLGNTARFPVAITTSSLSEVAWIRIEGSRGGGLYAYNPNGPEVRYVSRQSNDMPSNQVNQIAIDKNDEVWLATSEGVAFFQSSQSPFIPDFSDAIIPIFDGDLLLKDEYISAVAVDGGNRKWLGTRQGLWLFSENGNELVHHFTTDNSPLPSDTVEHITIDPINGEVFVSTTKGLVSYRSDATDAGPTFTDVKVFPNPITPAYKGSIGISGLASDVNVKITDVSGRLVREFFANGGSASWDGLDLYGQRVSTGVYLIFCSDDLGEETFVGKFAVVR